MFKKGLCWGYNKTYNAYQHNGRLAGASTYISLGNNGYSIVALFNETNSDKDLFTDMNNMMWSLTSGVTVPTHNLYDNDLIQFRLPVTQYQAKYNELASQGYRPAVIEGYSDNGTSYFDVIFRKDGKIVDAFHNRTAAEYQAEFDGLQKPQYKGWDLVSVTNYVYNGKVCYAGVFVKTNNQKWITHFHDNEAAFNTALSQNTAQGYKLVQGSRTTYGGKTYITSLFYK
jgi:hypothetical protein